MQKLSGISSGQKNKSCRIFHHESNKIGFAFLRILQETGNSFTIGVNLLQSGPQKET
jgi:hypothetical protein